MDSGAITLGGTGTVGEVARLSSEPGARRTEDQELFSQVISRAKANPDETPEQKARGAAQQLVATALVQPVLKQLRESNNAAPPFAPNEAERTFRSLSDAALAQRMVGSEHWELVNVLARRMLTKMGTRAESAPAQGAKT
jgi:Rod binding domain-containing protein